MVMMSSVATSLINDVGREDHQDVVSYQTFKCLVFRFLIFVGVELNYNELWAEISK